MSAPPKQAKRPLAFSRDGFEIKTRSTAEAGSKNCHFYKPLPILCPRDGFTYRQIAREGDVAIYEQRGTGSRSGSACYEVIRIRQREGFEIDGRFVEAAEVYPKAEAWGTDGFTFTDKGAALAKLGEISR